MDTLPPAQDRALTAALDRAATALTPLLGQGPPHGWEPGLRRPAMLADLLRALAGGWPAAGRADTDPFAVPTGTPAGAERWTHRAAAASLVGVRRVSTDPGQLTAAAPSCSPGVYREAPVALYARRWSDPRAAAPTSWLVLSALASHPGTDGFRALTAVTATFRDTGGRLEPGPAGRDGLLHLLPSSRPGHADVLTGGLTALTYLGAAGCGTAATVPAEWAAHLLSLWRARAPGRV